ncbi:hypothetical protein JRQ81_014101 [Phrynocephalus forsythii]|uniref:G-protein coupled receptors family 1 profile domain-containing protein n=1 Tax=Phrynocephalus forsythii TaxID=171643 RepID=A0A9Q1B2T4_9SAUR|nr:hypothetical protein JRQ81_014101 [Phrynocephalus forsythii]
MCGNRSGGTPNSTARPPEFAGEVVKLALMVFLLVAITLGNLLSLLVFLCVKKFRTSQGYLKTSLALADLAVGLIVVPYSVYREVEGVASAAKQETAPSDPLACLVTGLIFVSCTYVSMTTIFLLSLERCIAVLHPLQRKRIITKRRTWWLILVSWALSFSLAAIPLLLVPDITFQYNSCSKLCNYAFPPGKPLEPSWNVMLLYPVTDFFLLSGTFALNAITFAALHRYCKMRRNVGEQPSVTQLSFSDITAAKTIGTLTLIFLVSFIPISVFVVGSVAGYQWCQFSFYAFWILTANSCWNVAIYSVWDPNFRQGVQGLLNKWALTTHRQPSSCSLETHSSATASMGTFKEMLCTERI